MVIVGGGFAGLHLMRSLERRLGRGEADVTLVDRNNYHLFTPLLYQVATGELPPHAVAYPLRRPAARAGYRFASSEVESIDTEQRCVRTADGPLWYDHVVVVPGTVTNDFGIPGVRKHALFVKDLADAQAVRARILTSFERAALAAGDERRALLTFVIVGAGPVGVELASSMRDLMDKSLRPMYRDIDFDRDTRIHLLDGADRVIPQMDPRLSALAKRRLDEQGITLHLRTKVTEIREGLVRTEDGAELRGHTIVWAGGVRANPLVEALPLTKSRDKRLVVDRGFRADGRDDVFSFGDAAYFEHDGNGLPQLAQVAVLEAPTVALNLARAVRGLPPVDHRHKVKGDLVALGRRHAGAQLRGLGRDVVFDGSLAWWVWRGNYLFQLLGVRNRATLITEWTLSYYFSRMVANTP